MVRLPVLLIKRDIGDVGIFALIKAEGNILLLIWIALQVLLQMICPSSFIQSGVAARLPLMPQLA